MESVLIPLAAILSTFGSSAFIVYMFLKTRNRERMALIESGQDASIFRGSVGIHANLKWGYLMIAAGLAFLLGGLLEQYTRLEDETAYLPVFFLLGGLAFILYYRRARADGIEI